MKKYHGRRAENSSNILRCRRQRLLAGFLRLHASIVCVCLCLWQLVYQIHCNFILFLVHFVDVSAIVQFWSDLFYHWIIWKLSPLSAIFWINSIATVFPLFVQLESPVSHRISSFPSISTIFVSHIHIHFHIV